MLDYAEINPPTHFNPKTVKYNSDKPDCSCCGCIGEVAYVGILIIGLPILGVVYFLDFCFYKDGRLRSCFNFR